MIEIIQAERQQNTTGNTVWACWLQIGQAGETWLLPTTAPGALAENELQAYFDGREVELWRVAQEKRYPVDLFERVPVKRVLKAFALVALDEINLLRQRAGLPERTADQIVTAIKAKLR